VLALATFLALFGRMLAVGWRGYRSAVTAAEPLPSIILGSTLAIVGFLVGGLTQYNFGDAEVVVYVWFTAALLMRSAALASAQRAAEPPFLR
jgi:lipopolysaccharide export LptBFGC system permease protein LptF